MEGDGAAAGELKTQREFAEARGARGHERNGPLLHAATRLRDGVYSHTLSARQNLCFSM